jgi:branched-chain amino acid transport system substrate-binding protein
MKISAKEIGIVLVFLAVFIFLPGVHAQTPTKILKLGTVNPRTGPGALFGDIMVNKCYIPFTAMVNHKGGVLINGERHKVELLWADDKTTAAGARGAAEELIFRDKVKFIFGVLMGTSNLAIAPLTTEQKMITINGSGAVIVKPEFPYLFQTTPSVPQRLYAIFAVVKKKNPGVNIKRVAFLGPDDETGIQMYKVAPRMAAMSGYEITYNERHPRGIKDYYSFLTNILRGKPDALVLISSPTDAALIVKQSRELGFEGKLLYPSTISDRDSFLRTAGEKACQGFVSLYDDFNAPDVFPRMREFQEFCIKVLNRPADEMRWGAYMLTEEILLQAVERPTA